MADDVDKDKEKDKPKGFWTWDRSIEILKIVATVYAACIGTFVTMQFNERQHELARLEAIAKMLPHLADHADTSSSSSGSLTTNSAIFPLVGKLSGSADPISTAAGDTGSPPPNPPGSPNTTVETNRMMRDGAIWAIFRTANNKTMLRDLAALFPEDIYRVVSSIAAAGNLSGDEDAITALSVASEKLANRYTDHGENPALASRLYSQALRLKKRTNGDKDGLLYVVDLNENEISGPHDTDRQFETLQSLNQLAEMHYIESESSKNVNTGHYQAKQLFKRVISKGASSTDPASQLEVAKAQIGLARLYTREKQYKDAIVYMRDALALREKYLGKNDKQVADLCSEMANVLRLMPDGTQEAQQLQQRAAAILKVST